MLLVLATNAVYSTATVYKSSNSVISWYICFSHFHHVLMRQALALLLRREMVARFVVHLQR